MDAHHEAGRQEVASAEPDQSEKRKAPPRKGGAERLLFLFGYFIL